MNKPNVIRLLATVLVITWTSLAHAQPPQCDPEKVLTAQACAKCHAHETEVWKRTPHFQTFEQLHRNPRATEISRLMGERTPKRSDSCVNCHYTTAVKNGRTRVVSGISCESCHGAAEDWVNLHNDYGGPTATRETESVEHRRERVAISMEAGMRNPRNIYSIARSCLQCHTVPNEKLVNHAGHLAGSKDFELVSWSQGSIRHRFVSGGEKVNQANSPERLRVMYVAGKIADLEFSTRAVALATEKNTYGLTAAKRAARLATELYEIQQQINDPNLNLVLRAFAQAELKINNATQLEIIAAEIGQAGLLFAGESDGQKLAAIDPLIPDPTQYR